MFEGSLACAKQHGLEHEELTGAQVNARFPGAPVFFFFRSAACTPSLQGYVCASRMPIVPLAR